MLVDTHVHIWRYPEHFDKETMVFSQPERRKDWPDEKWKAMWDNPVERYLAEMDGVVDKAILVGVRGRTKSGSGLTIPNDYLADVVKQYPDKLAWACTVGPEEGAAKEVERCVRDLGAVGVAELVIGYQGCRLDDKDWYPVWEKTQELGVPVLVHATPDVDARNMRINDANVLMIDDIMIDFPELKVIIAHIGWPYSYREAVLLMQKHPNVFADIAYLTHEATLDRSTISKYLPVVGNAYFHWVEPLAYYFSQTWGFVKDKLLFGSDWPGTIPRDGIKALNNVNELFKKFNFPEVPQEAINNILYENWKKVYKL